MKVFRTVVELQQYRAQHDVEVCGFVPTMGALHAGHIALVERSVSECDMTVVSVFVNPTQFNDPRDLERYPRTERADLELLEAAGATVVFAPSVVEVYPEPDFRQFDFGVLEKVMEGASRPGHFNGVAQVVSRLFEIVKPDRAYFGEKDFQQLAIIRAMVGMLDLPVEIRGCEIVRADDGLAMSSRNMLLSAQQRQAAPHIYDVLCRMALKKGGVSDLEAWAACEIDKSPYLECEYVKIVNPHTLQEPAQDDPWHVCVAVRCGEIRLIDNLAIR